MVNLLSLDTSRDNMTDSNEQASEDYKNGFACPNCDEELFDTANSGLLESMPQQKEVNCKNCNFHGTRYVSND